MMQLETFTEAQIVAMLKMHYSKGVRVREPSEHFDAALTWPCSSCSRRMCFASSCRGS